MLTILGYGEDALTLRLLTGRLPESLGVLDDGSDPSRCLALYRPSFGRKGGPKSSQFGEFDAILATPTAVYPIEAKWARSARRYGLIPMEPRQVERHRIFEWLRNRWEPGVSWAAFVERNQTDFRAEFSSKPMAPLSSDLAAYMGCILDNLDPYPLNIRHILAVFYREERHKPRGISDCAVPFELLTFPLDPLDVGGVFELRGSAG